MLSWCLHSIFNLLLIVNQLNLPLLFPGMDGSHRQTIVSYEVKWPNGLTLDLVSERVYWVDAKLNIISSCNFDGSARRVVLYSTETLSHPFSVTTFEDWVYWTDWDKMAVFKANKFTGKDVAPVTAEHMVIWPALFRHDFSFIIFFFIYLFLFMVLYFVDRIIWRLWWSNNDLSFNLFHLTIPLG